MTPVRVEPVPLLGLAAESHHGLEHSRVLPHHLDRLRYVAKHLAHHLLQQGAIDAGDLGFGSGCCWRCLLPGFLASIRRHRPGIVCDAALGGLATRRARTLVPPPRCARALRSARARSSSRFLTSARYRVALELPLEASGGQQKRRAFAGLFRAAEGIRTVDLLHGTQNLRRRLSAENPCKTPVVDSQRRLRFPGAYREITGFGHRPDTRAPSPSRYYRSSSSPRLMQADRRG
jgi:hypothetical protein